MEWFIGIAVGLATSVVAWILVELLLRSRIRFSDKISRLESPHSPSGFRYRVKIQNVGLFRDVIDFQAQAAVHVQGLDRERPGTWTVIRLDMSTSARTRLRPSGNAVWSIDPSRLSDHIDRVLRDYDQIGIADRENRTLGSLLSIEGATQRQDGEPLAEPYLRIEALATDGWSGRQSYVRSDAYRLNDILDTQFRSVTRSWPRRLQDALRRRYPDLDVEDARAIAHDRQDGE